MYREIKAQMARRDITAAQLAEAIGISKTAFSLKMKGEREWKYSEMKMIRRILAPDMTLDELFATEHDEIERMMIG